MGKIDSPYIWRGFYNKYNYLLERSSEYTIGLPQSSTMGSAANVYTSNVWTTDKFP